MAKNNLELTPLEREARNKEAQQHQEKKDGDHGAAVSRKNKGKNAIFEGENRNAAHEVTSHPNNPFNDDDNVTLDKLLNAPTTTSDPKKHVTDDIVTDAPTTTGLNDSNTAIVANDASHDAIADIVNVFNDIVHDAIVVNDVVHDVIVINDTTCTVVDVNSKTHSPEVDDDFNYNDPIIAELLDKNWDDEIVINEILENATYKTLENKDTLTRTEYDATNKIELTLDITILMRGLLKQSIQKKHPKKT
ncbi:hypothetical protein Salat_2527800 [Sesamum alatum]|uniref:Uncharacterized protein n=1 Tax=Sesamum alatum TaxID=300844 RepID=A0AAE1XS19_9LAMI|nr:hypothetical protein Salat_2527800 [Sesamum alatum]